MPAGKKQPAKMPKREKMRRCPKEMPKKRETLGKGKAPSQSGPPPTPSSGKSMGLRLFPERDQVCRVDPGAIRQISCKHGYLAVVGTQKRDVLVFEPAAGKPGCPNAARRKPKHIKLKKNSKVDLLDSEVSHLLILSSEGRLSEHSLASRSVNSEPRLLKELGNKRIVQIACGDHHSMALSEGGELFAWGQNEYGQLGVGRKSSTIGQPQPVWPLENVPLAQIAAGSAHSMALSLSGTVFSWGKNAFGQLGLGDTAERCFPMHVKALEDKRIAFISCGGEHTAVLSKDGMVCTFGDGSHGQLGHNSRYNEWFPRLVTELSGAQVSQIACGRWHTLVYVPNLGEVYSFGSGAEGQLGKGEKCDRLIPLPLDLTVNGQKMIRGKNIPEEMVKIIAGEDQSIVLLLKEKQKYANLNRTLARVEEEKTEKWASNSDPKCWQNIEQEIKLIFSSAACINGSFQEKREKTCRTSSKAANVDMPAVFLFCEKIAAKPKVITQMLKALRKLLNSLSLVPASPEALRVFLIVPVLLWKEAITSDCLLGQLAQAICKLPEKDKQILETWWSNLDVTFFKDLVGMYQRLISANLSSVIKHLRCSESVTLSVDFVWPLQVLQMLYEVNRKTNFTIQESNFYIPELKRILAPPSRNNIWNEEQLIRRLVSKGDEIQLAFDILSQFPCIFELEDKILLHTLCCLFRHFNYSLNNPGIVSKLHVRRQHLMQDTWQCIRSVSSNWFQQFFKVQFEGEPGIDDGGLSQEFFTILVKELCAPKCRIFTHFDESHLIWFPPQVPAQKDIYFLIGNLFGMALYNQKIAAFPFPLALFKKMANVQPTLEDLKELFPTIGRSLQTVLDEQREDVIELLQLDFMKVEEHEGSRTMIELKENGANLPVTKSNRKEYVDAYVHYIFTTSVEKQFADFMRGFERGCPTGKWKIFNPIELQLVLLGHKKYDWEQFEKLSLQEPTAFQLKGWKNSYSQLLIQGKKTQTCGIRKPLLAVKSCSFQDIATEMFSRKCSLLL
ncbi:E3 ISG15--protein ligase HERC5 isoform X2 [Anolis carolinensis]|uniref:E3 ISG15--protein ligase HERC5 isoform X2 n=1 Tax=Anolis carolinensis TaxID=28377 RepID=UPI0007DB7A67|nr:PREDICTED: E3 ISG15--protein ligase HERC5 isoform X2 [Anolis carolinensis]|eukprot:XP_016849281.1 PREDICTED: E3 ISG15--protein ligase HERC5 isoform X2 [Anolis carolinensis]